MEIHNHPAMDLEVFSPTEQSSSQRSFIHANTIETSLEEIRHQHVIPVFIKDNEPVISHADFIDTAIEVVQTVYQGEAILKPSIRISHPIKGRIPEAKNKPASQLFEHEKTLYYERMAFAIEIPSIADEIDGNTLSLTVGGVKAYNLDNLYSKKGSDEHFKVFVGFQNRVCTNLCVWSDGYVHDLKVSDLKQLKTFLQTFIESFNAHKQIQAMQVLPEFRMSEHQFATLIGRCRMYQHLSPLQKERIPPLLIGDNQIGVICKDYYNDHSFCRDAAGDINLWKLYNLFTGANKRTYIDQFLDRSVNAFQFVDQLRLGMEGRVGNWFLN